MAIFLTYNFSYIHLLKGDFSMIHIKNIFIYILLSSVFFVSYCNPVSEDIKGSSRKMWNSLHSLKPFMSDYYYHGADYRFPAGACDEVQCHGSSLSGGNSGAPSCYTCHTDQWTVFGTTHTLEITKYYHHTGVDTGYDTNSSTNWFLQCKSCHGTNLDGVGGTAVYSCQVCHSGFTGSIPPPGHRISQRGNWHHYSAGGLPSSNCAGNACHGTGGTAGAAGPECSSCHRGTEWSTIHSVKPFQSTYFHGTAYRFPSGACDQVKCHNTALDGGSTGAPSCYICHTDQWTVFSTTHTLKISNNYHNTGVDTGYSTESNANWFSDCKSCHGSNLDGAGGTAVYSCKTCHSGFTGSIPPPGHRISREGNWHHYSYNDDPATYCAGASCHGSNGESGGTAVSSVAGIAGHGQSCSSSGCHY